MLKKSKQIFVVPSDSALLHNSPEATFSLLCEQQVFCHQNINRFTFYCPNPCLFQKFVVPLQPQRFEKIL